MQPGIPPRHDRNWRGWAIAAAAALILIVLLLLWGMRPGRQGQPGEPAAFLPSGSAATAPALIVGSALNRVREVTLRAVGVHGGAVAAGGSYVAARRRDGG